ncbi:hypothetical protein ALO65_200353 [Pseudomonas syringae pv. papulans]|nr:hypothetical protein ALO65_200353 [Pseudomonas syringae pv. papulans]
MKSASVTCPTDIAILGSQPDSDRLPRSPYLSYVGIH